MARYEHKDGRVITTSHSGEGAQLRAAGFVETSVSDSEALSTPTPGDDTGEGVTDAQSASEDVQPPSLFD